MQDVYIDFYDVSGDYSVIYKMSSSYWFGTFNRRFTFNDLGKTDIPNGLIQWEEPSGGEEPKMFRPLGSRYLEPETKTQGLLKKDHFYVIKFVFKEVNTVNDVVVFNDYKNRYRFLYTTKLMNPYYFTTNDFKDVAIDYNISFNKNSTVTWTKTLPTDTEEVIGWYDTYKTPVKYATEDYNSVIIS
ncbi:MAG: hypothetical protein Nk1A_8630 [Endomicrobiia bacterium]|nr:MAG: hypothetical protein Nk1A_8630 [Endomicrobiia bacterium]